MKKIKNILWGLVLILLGVIFALNALGVTNINVFFDGWWTLFIIIPCFIGLFNDNEKTGNFIGLGIGIVLLLCCQDLFDFAIAWKLLIPFILIIIGLSIIFKDVLHSKVKNEINKINKDNSKIYCSTFSGQKADYTNEEFEGCELNSIFGGIKCDLRKAIINDDVVITTSAIFGGIDIYVPDDVQIKITSNSIFGGVSNNRKNKEIEKNTKTIYINATCIFGGVEIK